MEVSEALRKAQRKGINPQYMDFTLLKSDGFKLAYRGESLELSESGEKLLVARVVDGGYGIASTTKLTQHEVRRIASLALSHANIASPIKLRPVKAERGIKEQHEKKVPTVEEAREMISLLSSMMKEKLKSLKHHIEVIFEYQQGERQMASTEGHELVEKVPYTTLILYASVMDKGVTASEVVGGQGGMEVLSPKDWDAIINTMSQKIMDSLRGKILSPFVRGSRFNVILDEAATGFLAHEVAHALEADNYNPSIFRGLMLSSYAKIHDDPTLPYGYGSRTWDDEGVKTVKKELLSKDHMTLLHTRLTAREEDRPGNARGTLHKPKALMSNVYIAPGDWKVDELFEETKEAIFIQGVVRAELNTATGLLTMQAESAYYYRKRKGFEPLLNVTLQDSIRHVLSGLDATTALARVRPNIELGYPVSDGGPYTRLVNVRCS